MPVFRLAPLLSLLLLPQAASAGPIEWGYETEVVYARDYGPRFEAMVAPDGAMTTTPGDVAFVNLFDSAGASRPEPGAYEAKYDFDIRVTLTDLASGQSAALMFAGGYSSLWSYQPGDDPNDWRWDYESSTFGDYGDVREVTLGTTRYSVRAYGGDNGRFPFGGMEVRAEAMPTSPTPEPGTLALVGVGLAAVALRRFKPSLGGEPL